MKILFVDNHVELTAVVTSSFLAGHDVTVVPTIAAARRSLEISDFDVALVDYDLDDGKGDEVIRWARHARPTLPLVAVSARSLGNDALVAAGAERVCAKIHFARIGDLLAEIAGRRR